MNKSSQGNALTGIIIILLVLIVAGMFFYRNTKKQVEANKAAQERARMEQNATVFEAVQ